MLRAAVRPLGFRPRDGPGLGDLQPRSRGEEVLQPSVPECGADGLEGRGYILLWGDLLCPIDRPALQNGGGLTGNSPHLLGNGLVSHHRGSVLSLVGTV